MRLIVLLVLTFLKLMNKNQKRHAHNLNQSEKKNVNDLR